MSVPKVILKSNFIYEWHVGSNDLLGYYERPQAFYQKSREQMLKNKKEYADYDMIEYMRNEEKSDGIFSATMDKLSEKEISEFRKLEIESQKQGCPKYINVLSFDNSFLVENQLMVNGIINYAKIKQAVRAGVDALIKAEPKLESDNVEWCGAIHTNTDNVHIHFSLIERERREDRTKKYRDKDMLSVKAFDSFKSAVASSIIQNDKRTAELTRIEREILLPKLEENFTNTTAQMYHLLSILPEDNAWQYNRPKMKKFRAEIDCCVKNIINSNDELSQQFNAWVSALDDMGNYYRSFYGDGNLHKYMNYKTNKLNDFYSRAGNKLLQELAQIKLNMPETADTKEENTTKYFCIADSELEAEEKRLLDLIKKGDSSATYKLGKLYLERFPEKAQEGLEILNDEVAMGNNYAQLYLGRMYTFGPNRNLQTAKKYLVPLAEKGNTSASYQLGKAYLSDKKYDEAEKWLLMSAKGNNQYAQFTLGMYYKKTNRQSEAEHMLSASAAQGNKFADVAYKRLMHQKGRTKGATSPYSKRKITISKSRNNYQFSMAMATINRLYNEYMAHLQQLQKEFEYENYICVDENDYDRSF